MNTPPDCLACFTRQLDDILRLLDLTPGSPMAERIRLSAAAYLETADRSQSPPAVAAGLHRIVREITGNPDPYHALKKEYNTLAMDWYGALKARVREARDPFGEAVRIAIAGNIIDFGVNTPVTPDSVRKSIEESEVAPLDSVTLERLRTSATEAETILYLGDNCGEVVFDRVLIEELPAGRVIFAVRGAPVLNDITREDAVFAGINGIAEVIDNGTDAPGTPLENCSRAFLEQYRQADLIIAKGQGNYETLCERGERIFFLFRVKCPLVEKLSGLPLGSLALLEQADQSRPKSSSSRSISSSPK